MSKEKMEKSSHDCTTVPPEAAKPDQQAMKLMETQLLEHLNRAKRASAKRAVFEEQLAQAHLKVLRKSDVDEKALRAAAKELWRQREKTTRGTLKLPSAPLEMEGFQSGTTSFTLLQPPYTYDWSATGYVDYAPGILSAYATPGNGQLGFDVESSEGSHQVNRSHAAAAVGVYFKPVFPGQLSIFTNTVVGYDWAYNANYAGANTRGWAGFLVQSYKGTALADTPIIQEITIFNEGYNGQFIGFGSEAILPFASPPLMLGYSATLPVQPQRWYIIWFWCGGDIHADGWQTVWGTEKGSDAAAKIDIQVPFLLLQFTSLIATLPTP